LDIGESRVGVALSDPAGTVATPHAVWDAKGLLADPTPLRRLVDDYEVGEVVVGLPLSMDGSEGLQASVARRYAESLAERVEVPFVYQDERLSSVEAQRVMASSGLDSKARRGRVDMVAAAILLQTYLESNRRPEEGAPDG
jgi:putative Holliday junction resolvase